MHVFIVHDAPFRLHALCDAITSQLPHVTITTAPLSEGLARLAMRRHELVLVDLSTTSRVEDVQVLKQVKRRWPTTALIVAVPAGESRWAEILGGHAWAIFQKPLDPAAVLAALSAALRRHDLLAPLDVEQESARR